MTNPKIGIFGGAFDPFTVAHREIARQFIDLCHLDELYIIPSSINYHRKGKEALFDFEKCEVITWMIDTLPYHYAKRITLDDMEWNYEYLCRKMPGTYWDILVGGRRFIHTLLEFRNKHDMVKPFVCIGTDEYKNLSGWYMGDEIPNQCTLVVVQGRNDEVVEVKEEWARQIWMPEKFRNVSATKVRKSIFGKTLTHYREMVEAFDEGEKTLAQLGWV